MVLSYFNAEVPRRNLSYAISYLEQMKVTSVFFDSRASHQRMCAHHHHSSCVTKSRAWKGMWLLASLNANYLYRPLSVTELGALQGFSTPVVVHMCSVMGAKATSLAIGNSMTLPVLTHILMRLLSLLG